MKNKRTLYFLLLLLFVSPLEGKLVLATNGQDNLISNSISEEADIEELSQALIYQESENNNSHALKSHKFL